MIKICGLNILTNKELAHYNYLKDCSELYMFPKPPISAGILYVENPSYLDKKKKVPKKKK